MTASGRLHGSDHRCSDYFAECHLALVGPGGFSARLSGLELESRQGVHGDVGSTFLGAVFAALLLQSSSWLEALGYLLVATPLLGDACLCVVRRLLTGQNVFEPHRLHLHQRLHQSGWPHSP